MGNLLHYAIVFLVVALGPAAVGFDGVASFAMEAARLVGVRRAFGRRGGAL
ncbi:MAG: DUF1328 domain-containing protein [Hyphomonadaceae bacterium]|nr:DUF1328 domain-containing protein [Hyphomonadaceae bacterium]